VFRISPDKAQIIKQEIEYCEVLITSSIQKYKAYFNCTGASFDRKFLVEHFVNRYESQP
jgi:hypothetical protein